MTADSNGDPRRDFARKYLEKLINIRVPIRRPIEQESRALLATMSAPTIRPPLREHFLSIMADLAPVPATPPAEAEPS